MNHKSKNFIGVLLILLVIVIAGVIYSCTASANGRKETKKAEVTEEKTEETSLEAEEESAELICVHVCGSVARPGVYYLKKGARVHEAVEQAGGMTELADRQYINLAKEAEDGVQIYIPTMEEVAAGLVPAAAEGAAVNTDDGLVNINTATLDELKTLPGIGDIKAEAILSYRESAGGFAAIEEIMNVAGIKESSYEKIKDHIKV